MKLFEELNLLPVTEILEGEPEEISDDKLIIYEERFGCTAGWGYGGETEKIDKIITISGEYEEEKKEEYEKEIKEEWGHTNTYWRKTIKHVFKFSEDFKGAIRTYSSYSTTGNEHYSSTVYIKNLPFKYVNYVSNTGRVENGVAVYDGKNVNYLIDDNNNVLKEINLEFRYKKDAIKQKQQLENELSKIGLKIPVKASWNYENYKHKEKILAEHRRYVNKKIEQYKKMLEGALLKDIEIYQPGSGNISEILKIGDEIIYEYEKSFSNLDGYSYEEEERIFGLTILLDSFYEKRQWSGNHLEVWKPQIIKQAAPTEVEAIYQIGLQELLEYAKKNKKLVAERS